RRQKAGAFAEHSAPQRLGLGVLAEAAADDSELVASPVSAEAVGHAGEVLLGLRAQQAHEGGVGAVQVVLVGADQPFEVEQFLVVGANRLAASAGLNRLGGPSCVHEAVGDQGVELADDAVARVRALQAFLQQRESFGVAAQIGAGGAEVEQGE